MPIRARSHQLEDKSITYFKSLIPEQWAPRSKDHDYGSDLEIEIFDEKGNSTGLIFLIQMKATDQPNYEKTLTLPLEQISYFYTLDLPTLIVRYCSVGDKIYSQWHFNINLETTNPEQKTFTYHFSQSDAWDKNESHTRIAQTLSTIRLLKNYPSSMPISVTTQKNCSSSDWGKIVDRALYNILSRTPTLTSKSDCPICLDVVALDQIIQIKLDCFSAIEVRYCDENTKLVESDLLYAFASLLLRFGLRHHATNIAKLIVENNKPASLKWLGFHACLALENDLDSSVLIALLNSFQEVQDTFYLSYCELLLTSNCDERSRKAAINEFYKSALRSAGESNSKATIHYSLGNALASQRNFSGAMFHFNHARHLRPAYLQSDYFISEVGGSLFSSGHYVCAAHAYSKALKIKGSKKNHLCLADALLFSGQVQASREHYLECLDADEFFWRRKHP